MDLKCANCGTVFDEDDDILTITDNQLIFRYFDCPKCGRKLAENEN